MSGFKKNENLNTQGESSKKLAPGIYIGGNITEVTKGEKQIYNSEDKEVCLNVTFRDATGKEHLEQLGTPKETAKTTLDEALTYGYENMLHLAHPFLTDEEMTAFETYAGSFDEIDVEAYNKVVDKFIEVLTPKLETKVDIIIEGSVLNGKTPVSKFPNFNSRSLKNNIKPTAYITKSGGSVSLKETNNQRKGKESYFAALTSTTATTTEGGAKKATPDDLF